MSDINGPYFDDLSIGDVFDTSPALTLTDGRAAAHQAIIGGRLRLSLDASLAEKVTGARTADPAFAWDVAIGQSTQVTRRVVANLFYRGLAFQHLPAIGDTLRTRTEVVALRQNASRPTGLAALRVTTVDQEDRTVLDFWRCAMLPLSAPEVTTGHTDDLGSIGSTPSLEGAAAQLATWDLSQHPMTDPPRIGQTWTIESGDVVTSAPELARLSLNLAHVHHDEHSQPAGRLVYGGHTIGLAGAQLTRAIPELVTIIGWHGCDHTGPVREGDTVRSHIEIEDVAPLTPGLAAVHLRVRVGARRRGAEDVPVLDWRPIGVLRVDDHAMSSDAA